MSILSSIGTLLTSLQGWAFLKVPTTGKMTSQNVRDTCKGLGYSPTCYQNDDHVYNDDKCVKPLKGHPKETLYQVGAAVCPENENPAHYWSCKPMEWICEYMGLNYNGGSTICDEGETGSNTSGGKNLENKWSSCAFKL